MPLFGDVNVI